MARSDGVVALVAGGAGFVGSHLIDTLLERGATVVCLDSYLTGRRENLRHLASESRFCPIEADVVQPLPDELFAIPFTHVYNLACAASPPHYQADPVHTLLTCVVGSRHLLDLAAARRARYFLASTSEVYGDPFQHPQTETYRGSVNCTGPRACYDEGKRAAETLAFDYLRLGLCVVRVGRFFNTYGPRMRRDDGRVISNMICQALTGEPVTIYGDGSQTRSFCYVSDLVDGMTRLMEKDEVAGPVNLGNPGEFTVNELAEKVLRMTGSAAPLVRRPLPVDDPRRRRPDIALAQHLLGWQPLVPLERGLRATIDWFAADLAAAAADAVAGPELRIEAPLPAAL